MLLPHRHGRRHSARPAPLQRKAEHHIADLELLRHVEQADITAVTLRGDAASFITDASPVFKLHLFLGMSLFVIFPFTRLVHVWSGLATVAYLFRPYQLVRSRRLNVPAGHNLPRSAS